jgi:hypothetical protein
MIKSSLRLFKALPLAQKKYNYDNSKIVERTLKHGYIFSPEIYIHFPKSRMDDICSIVEDELIIRAEEINSTFHKSWNKVKTAPYLQLLLEQIFHYITTYGYEALEVYDKDLVYFPNEKLEIPELKKDVPLMVIKGYTKAEIREKLLNVLGSGIALKEDTIHDLVETMNWVGGIEIEQVKNKEIKMALYKELNKVPENPVEFLRYIIFDLTGKTLLIKDRATIESLKESDEDASKLFDLYDKKYGLPELSTIFYRFKPLFLALKNGKMKPVINKIRKLATFNHEPMKEDYLNTVTKQIKDHTLQYNALRKALKNVNTFRKVRLAYALKYRTLDVDSILYKIRNGKGFVDSFSFDFTPKLGAALDIVIGSIVYDVAKNVDGKTIYIPKNINYTLPATEKQFTGNFPSGTSIEVKEDLIFGVQWRNNPGFRVDLDLSLINAGEKIGWDGVYRNEEGILFSGDITDPDEKNGASELFYIKKQIKQIYLVYLNYYNYNAEQPVPFTIVAAQKKLQKITSNYTIDPNNVIATASSTMDKQQKVLGIVTITTGGCKFYFSETYVGRSISATNNEQSEMNRNYLVNFYKNTIRLDEILTSAGAIVVDEEDLKDSEIKKITNNKIDIDLSPEKLEKDTILNLLI